MDFRWTLVLAVSGLLAGPATLPLVPSDSPAGSTSGPLGPWSNLSQGPSPPAGAGTTMAYDPPADRFVWFGGWNGSTFNETWALDARNGSWIELHPASSPPARADATFVFDSLDGLFYLFGGWSQRANGSLFRYNDTWTFSLVQDRWTELFPAVAPSPRSDSAIAFDPAANVTILFGGFSGSIYLGDAWAFSPGANTWTALPERGNFPSARADGRMTYDASTNRFVLFGGNDYSGPNLTFHHLNDTWNFQETSDSWSLLSTPSSPPARDYAVQATDPTTGWTLLFGGYGNRTILGDLWAFSPSNDSWWSIRLPGAPPPRFAGTGGYDTVDRSLFLVGGLGQAALLNDTWRLGPGASSSSPGPAVPGYLVAAVVVMFAAVLLASGILVTQRRRRRRGDRSPPLGP